MLSSILVLTLCIFTASVTAAGKPDCVSKCWDYSQYVSDCGPNHSCLCEDSEFQNTVYQCLYSQCGTSQFGSALHHALQICASKDQMKNAKPQSISPPLVHQENLHKRVPVHHHGMRSVSASQSNSRSVVRSRGSPTRSAVRSATMSRGSPIRSATRSASASVVRSATMSRGSPMRSAARGSPTAARGSPDPAMTYLYPITTIADHQPQAATYAVELSIGPDGVPIMPTGGWAAAPPAPAPSR